MGTKGTLLLGIFLVSAAMIFGGCSKSGDSPPKTGPAASAPVGSDVTDKEYVITEKNKILEEGVKNAKFVLETKDGKDVLTVVVLDKVKDGDSLTYQYGWSRNGEPAGQGTSVEDFKRGDKMTVSITPVDGEKRGRSKTLGTEINNSTPKIKELKNIASDDKLVSYQVVAVDRDGDPLTYTLADGPKGMTIDGKSGVLQWTPDPQVTADFTVTVKVSDGHGGETTYPLKVAHVEKPAN